MSDIRFNRWLHQSNTGGVYQDFQGNVGIGTSVPQSRLDVVGNVIVSGNIVNAGIITATKFYGDGSNLSDIISGVGIATAGGIVGTGVTILDLRGAGISTVTVSSGIATINVEGGGGGGGFSVTNNTTTNSTFYPVFVDSTSGTPTQTSVSSTKLTFNPFSGTLSATIFTSLSDETQKTDITPITNAIKTVKQIQGVKYKWVDNHSQPSIGVIAQEIEKVLPEVVVTNEQGLKTVSYGNIVGLLIEAIKEQQVRIEELERKLNA